jgi:ribosomal protein L10
LPTLQTSWKSRSSLLRGFSNWKSPPDKRNIEGLFKVFKENFPITDTRNIFQLNTLRELKSKADLVGEIIGMLQSPAKNVISALNAGGKLASLVKALEERAQ